MPDSNKLRDALLAGTHSIKAICDEFCTPDTREPVDLTGRSQAEIADLAQSLHPILPTPDVAKYLASGDVLTDKTINSMEIAIETQYGIKAPYYVDSRRTRSGTTVTLDGFFLDSTDR
jgi:hypothetical protein